jgi:glutaredoxin domain-containing cysteine-rich protein 1
MSRFGTEVVKLKCTVCNEQGLQKCPECQHAQALEEASEA